MKLRRFAIIVAAVAAISMVSAAASMVTVGTNQIGSGKATVAKCDTNGGGGTPSFTFTYTLDGSSHVTSVTVGDIDAACNGGALSLTVANGSGARIGSGGGTVAATSQAFTISAQPQATAVASIAVAIVGP